MNNDVQNKCDRDWTPLGPVIKIMYTVDALPVTLQDAKPES